MSDDLLAYRKALSERFPPELERHFEGRGGRTFTYVSDEAVMDRLDDALGLGNWEIACDPMGEVDTYVAGMKCRP